MKICDIIRIETTKGPLLVLSRHNITDNVTGSFAIRRPLYSCQSKEEALGMLQLLGLEMPARTVVL